MAPNKILHAEHGHQCFVKMVGEIRHPLSPSLDAFINQVFHDGKTNTFVIDLSETRFIDSTNLGLLAKIARQTMQNKWDPPILVSGSEEVDAVLESMGFDEAFTVVGSAGCPGEELHETPAADVEVQARARLILEAHRALADMNDTCRDMFHDVVEMFEREVASQSRPSDTKTTVLEND